MQPIRQTLTNIGAWWRRQSRRRKIFSIVGLLLVLYIIFHKGGSDMTTTVETVKRQDLVQTVSASGTVVSSTDLSLGFEQSKMVSSVGVAVGAKVKKGDVLASLSNGTERAAVSSAKGSLLAARARYNKVLEGSSNEEIKLAQVELANARRTLMSEDLEAKADSVSTTIAPTISGSYVGAEGEYRLEFNKLAQNMLEYNGIEKGTVRVNDIAPVKLGTKGLYVQFPAGTLDDVPSGTVWTVMIPNVEGASYIANKAMVDQKEAALAVAQATARQADVDVALADVVVAQAGVDNAVAALEKTILRAPADGTITAVDVKIGEIAEIGKQAVALQDVGNLYLEANVNESSIKSVAVGQSVSVTFDAFAGDTYHATISSIDPAATIDNNVVNYKIKALVTETDRIRPGMTANMTILTAQVPQVLVIPGRMITTTDGVSTVQVVTDERKQKTESRTVTTGLRGDGDMVEIQSGLTEGERVLLTTK
jgi:RND family efflux transporter MFP subunit